MPQTTLVLGKHSGRHAVQKRCDSSGLTLSRRDLDDVYRRMVAVADTQKHISDEDLLDIVGRRLRHPPGRRARATRPCTKPGTGSACRGRGFFHRFGRFGDGGRAGGPPTSVPAEAESVEKSPVPYSTVTLFARLRG